MSSGISRSNALPEPLWKTLQAGRKRDGRQFIFVRNLGKKTKGKLSLTIPTLAVVGRFLRNLHRLSVLADLDPLLLMWTPLQNFLFFNFRSIMKLFSFVGGWVWVSKLHTVTSQFLWTTCILSHIPHIGGKVQISNNYFWESPWNMIIFSC